MPPGTFPVGRQKLARPSAVVSAVSSSLCTAHKKQTSRSWSKSECPCRFRLDLLSQRRARLPPRDFDIELGSLIMPLRCSKPAVPPPRHPRPQSSPSPCHSSSRMAHPPRRRPTLRRAAPQNRRLRLLRRLLSPRKPSPRRSRGPLCRGSR